MLAELLARHREDSIVLGDMGSTADVDLPVAHVRAQVASAIDVVVHTARMRDGRRVVFQIASVEGLDPRGDPVVSEIFGFRPRLGPHGAFVATGVIPEGARLLRERGAELDDATFTAGVDSPGTA